MIRRAVIATLVGLCLAVCANCARAMDLANPEPTSYTCRGFDHVAEIFPPQCRQNPTDMPLCYMYSMGYRKVDAKLVWKAPLVNAGTFHMPYEALVSMDGILVTLNEYGKFGDKNTVVIYDKDGKLVKSYALEDLLPKEDLAKCALDMRGLLWNPEAKYFFLEKPARFYIVLKWGKTMEFMLKDGAFKYGLPTDFPDLAAVRKRQFPNEEAEVWPTNLRFSSITDVVALQPGKQPPQANHAEASDLNEAVSIGTAKLAELKKPAEKFKLVGAEQRILKDKYIWLLTFKSAELLPVDPAKQLIGLGVEIFIKIDLKTKETTVTYGE